MKMNLKALSDTVNQEIKDLKLAAVIGVEITTSACLAPTIEM